MKIAVVAVKDTLDDGTGFGSLSPGEPARDAKIVLERLKRDGYYIIIADSFANSQESVRILIHWLHQHELVYDDIWLGYGMPQAELYVNNNSKKVKDVLNATTD
jgi:hypothetical protein